MGPFLRINVFGKCDVIRDLSVGMGGLVDQLLSCDKTLRFPIRSTRFQCKLLVRQKKGKPQTTTPRNIDILQNDTRAEKKNIAYQQRESKCIEVHMDMAESRLGSATLA